MSQMQKSQEKMEKYTVEQAILQERLSLEKVLYLAENQRIGLEGNCGVGMMAMMGYDNQTYIYQLRKEGEMNYYFEKVMVL